MVPAARQAFNAQFTDAQYEAYVKYLNDLYNYEIEFRIAETPIFIPRDLKHKVVRAGEHIIDLITSPDFKARTDRAVPQGLEVPNETPHTHFLAIDWAISTDDEDNFAPRLIELQGFPSLYGFQEVISQAALKFWPIPDNFEYLFNGLDTSSYLALLAKVILGEHAIENVILLEIEPEKQKTKVDFYAMEQLIGLRSVCLTDVILEDRRLYYMRDGVKTRINRIYNRVIFDELQQRTDLKLAFDMQQDVEVEWAGHPAWFFRISKYILPMLESEFVPKTWFLNELPTIPTDLENYVLKPLFSFAGSGVLVNVTKADIEAIPDPENWILMKKVNYAPAVKSLDIPVKVELRMLYLWPDGDARPTLATSLVRMSKGLMMGVKFNKNFTWVGGSLAFFEAD